MKTGSCNWLCWGEFIRN